MSRHQILLLFICFCLKFNLAHSFTTGKQTPDSTESSTTIFLEVFPEVADKANLSVEEKYQCPPCGCKNDGIIFFDEGKCTMCGMQLVPVKQGMAGQVDHAIAHWFNSGLLGKWYTKLIYPVFAIGILLSILLLISGIKNKSQNVFLFTIILTLSLYGFKNQLYGANSSIFSSYKSLFAPISIILLIGPLIYFYVKSLSVSSFKWRKRDWIHFAPTLFTFLFYTTALLMPDRIQKQLMFSPFEITLSHTEQVITVISGLLYLVLALAIFKKSKVLHSSQHKWLSAWLTRFLIGMSALLLFWGLILFINFWLYDFGLATVTYNPLWVFSAGLLIWLFIEVLSNPKFFLIKRGIGLIKGNGNMDDAQFFQYQQNLETLMIEQKLYTNPNLNLEQLAKEMNINRRYLSMILNSRIGKNFYDFINYYRIEEVKQLLNDPDNKNLTIEAIANKSGFKSKSSFNAAFKKLMNMTPREYINNSKN